MLFDYLTLDVLSKMVSDDEFPLTRNNYRNDSTIDENSDVILNEMEETRRRSNFQMNFDLKSDRFSDISDFEEDNNLLIQASQEIEKMESSERFSMPGCTRIRFELETYQHH